LSFARNAIVIAIHLRLRAVLQERFRFRAGSHLRAILPTVALERALGCGGGAPGAKAAVIAVGCRRESAFSQLSSCGLYFHANATITRSQIIAFNCFILEQVGFQLSIFSVSAWQYNTPST
jgi:hypothetical protein